jgi:hypothetical protein
MALQTSNELIRVADEWFRNFCPSNLVKDGPSGTKNAELILGRCLQKYGILTISGMTESAHELGPEGKLTLIPEPKEPTQAEIAAKLEAKMRRDYLDSLKPQHTLEQQKLSQERLDSNKKAANEKELKTLLSQIEREISEHVVGHASGHQDYSRTESERETLLNAAQLRNVRDVRSIRSIENARRALSAVRTKKATL